MGKKKVNVGAGEHLNLRNVPNGELLLGRLDNDVEVECVEESADGAWVKVAGWVSSKLLKENNQGQAPSETSMGDLLPHVQKALTLATSHLDESVQPCKTAGCKFNPNDKGERACDSPDPAPEADDEKMGIIEEGRLLWFYYCMRFAGSVYGLPPGKSAQQYHDFFKEQRKIVGDVKIPVGALAFWRYGGYGHVGIHAGGEQIIHTGASKANKKQGVRAESLEAISRMLGKGSYLGWYLPEK